MVELLHKRLKRLYKERKKKFPSLTHDFIANYIGVSHQSVDDWFSGNRKIQKYHIHLLADILATPVEELLADTIQITGKKQTINFSKVKLSEITGFKRYDGLTIAEVQTVLEYKKQLEKIYDL